MTFIVLKIQGLYFNILIFDKKLCNMLIVNSTKFINIAKRITEYNV